MFRYAGVHFATRFSGKVGRLPTAHREHAREDRDLACQSAVGIACPSNSLATIQS